MTPLSQAIFEHATDKPMDADAFMTKWSPWLNFVAAEAMRLDLLMLIAHYQRLTVEERAKAVDKIIDQAFKAEV